MPVDQVGPEATAQCSGNADSTSLIGIAVKPTQRLIKDISRDSGVVRHKDACHAGHGSERLTGFRIGPYASEHAASLGEEGVPFGVQRVLCASRLSMRVTAPIAHGVLFHPWP